ncbi:hypothetical protein PVIIG_06267 [Plasmodium vivax India VII]|uniref:Uncharacterized protein n=1 Tax=Plasmodium vivax India VII TaxID=1077284 RepID=A0A0J9S1Q8_PLAVI|nr:hypothetical protein PVIIG_06267 [Plasmodium vivax India VII]
MGFEVKDYCRYINFWLNCEVRTKKYEKYQPHFKIFKDFVNNYAYEKQKNYTDTCIEYIHNIDEDVYIRMKFLYEFYELCDDLTSSYQPVKNKACEDLSNKTINYNYAIVDYYNKDRDLYDKISPVKNLIEKIIKEPATKCKQTYPFTIPPRVLEEEKEKKELARIAEERRKQEDAARQRREAEEDERRRREAEAANRQSTQRIQQDLEPQRGIQQMHTPHDVQREIFQQGVSLRSVELENPGETLHLEEQDPSNLLRHRLRLRNSGRYEDSQERALGQLYEDQLEKGVHKQENQDTRTEGSYIGSSGFPGYITDVFRSVKPAPILGVSGGMGALFLLFKVFKFL